MLKRNQVAGIITVSYHDDYAHERLNLPIVSIDRIISEMIPHISSDNYQGGRIAIGRESVRLLMGVINKEAVSLETLIPVSFRQGETSRVDSTENR